MRRWLFIAMGVLFFGSTARAIPARGVPIPIRQADGTTITIIVRGDEYSGWTSTVDGYQIVEREGVYYYYDPQVSRAGSGVKASNPSSRKGYETLALVGRATGRIDGYSPGQRMHFPLTDRLTQSKSDILKPLTFPSRALVLLVEFKDLSFQSTAAQQIFHNQLNIGPESARQYFIDNSNEGYQPTFEVKGPYRLSNTFSYYGENKETRDGGGLSDKRPQEMVAEACRAAAQAGVNFKDYDSNGDGVVDNVYVIFAGQNEAEGGGTQTIWPHSWSLDRPGLALGGVYVQGYACGSELARRTSSEWVTSGIGTFVHEFSHVLGLPDFYDTDEGSNGQGVGLYHFSVMSRGNYNNEGRTPPYYTAIERWLLGWGELRELEADRDLTIRPVDQQPFGWRISTGQPGEFYVIESRSNQRWDSFLGSTGLLIYHLDRSTTSVNGTNAVDRWQNNTINTVRSHPCARLIESGGSVIDAPTVSVGQIFFPGSKQVVNFGGRSTGGLDWRGNAIAVELTSMVNQAGTVSLSTRASEGTGNPLSFRVAQRSALVMISPKLYAELGTSVSYLLESQAEGKVKILTPFTGTPASVSVLKLLPSTRYQTTLYAVLGNGSKQELASESFTTTSLLAPYPALTGAPKTAWINDQIQLGVTNLQESPTKVVYSINGTALTSDSYTFTQAGKQTIRCTITYQGTDTEIIERIVTVTDR